jgi:hypothetical protein
LEEIIFENFNISENNIISVELAKVLRYCPTKTQAREWPNLLLLKPKEYVNG